MAKKPMRVGASKDELDLKGYEVDKVAEEKIKTDKHEEIAQVGDILGSEKLAPDEFKGSPAQPTAQPSPTDDKAEKALGDSFNKIFGKIGCVGLPEDLQKEKYNYFYSLANDVQLGQSVTLCMQKWMGKQVISPEIALVGAGIMFGVSVLLNRTDLFKPKPKPPTEEKK
jgi:hypothetical protein